MTLSPAQSLDIAYETTMFARQGGGMYSEPARQALDIVTSNTDSKIPPDKMWNQFCQVCQDEFEYEINDMTKGPVIDLPEVLNEQEQERKNFYAWIDSHIEAGTLSKVKKRLRDMYGVGMKIARLTLRQAVWALDRESDLREDELRYVHPIDGQVAAIIQAVWSDVDADPINNRDKWAHHLVSACSTAGVSNIEFNQGAWYWSSEVFDQSSNELEQCQLISNNPDGPRTEDENKTHVVTSPSSEDITVSTATRERFMQYKTEHGYPSDEATVEALLDSVEY